jgi:hypothetical protein
MSFALSLSQISGAEMAENIREFDGLVVHWLGGRESLPQLSETPTKTGVLSTTRMMSAN